MNFARKIYLKNSFLNIIKRNIHLNGKYGFYVNNIVIKVPEDEIDHVQETKDFLNRLKPEVLCITFWNSWNPICKNNLNNYYAFSKKNGGMTHFFINVDKFPKLRWYYDAKMEPSTKMYYYGCEINNFKGCNYDKINRDIQHAMDYLRNDYKSHNGIEEWEQPYFKWESELSMRSNPTPGDAAQSSSVAGFRPLTILQGMPNEPRGMHWGIRK